MATGAGAELTLSQVTKRFGTFTAVDAPKYAPAGDAITLNRYSADGWLTPRPRCVAIMNGRRYRALPSPAGIQSLSVATSSSSARRNVASGSSGIAIRRAPALNRAALACGRNRTTAPLSCR